MNAMIAENLLPGSSLKNREHFMEFLRLVKEGKRGLIQFLGVEKNEVLSMLEFHKQ